MDATSMDDTSGRTAPTWRKLLAAFAATLLLAVGVLAAFVTLFDPYGVGPLQRRDPVLMDLNQRFMYPQVIRSHRFDAAVTGTSTVRLLNPERLDALFGVKAVNLAMNSATAWEQMRIADLFLRETPRPKLLVMGIDPLWCAQDATEPSQRLTFRAFPESFYDDDRWNDWPHLFNLKSLEIAWRLVLNRVGAMPERLRFDGYEVFTPPEESYDLAKARSHIYGDRDSYLPRAATPAADESGPFGFPALAWLDSILARMPADSTRILVFPPAHVSTHMPPDSPGGRREAACKDAVATIAAERGATLLDFRIRSPITVRDDNYWDKIHYRLSVAERIARGLADAVRSRADDPEGAYRVLVKGRMGQPAI